MAENDDEEFSKWLAAGASASWISLPVCVTHEGFPTREWEELVLMHGEDPCIFVMRLWKDGMEDLDVGEMLGFWIDDETE